MNHLENRRNWESFFLYLFGFILLWEWIRPLKKLTDTGNLSVFIFYILLSFIVAFFQVNIWLSIVIRVGYILSSLYVLYFEGGFFTKEWFSYLGSDIATNIQYTMNGEWLELSNIFRTMLFFLLLSLMTYLIHYWLLNRKQIFLFFLITLIYITILDTFTPYSAKEAIIRAVITGFAAMGILTLNRIMVKEKVGKAFNFSRKWMTSLIVLIVASVGLGYIAPKAEPIWPDPVPYIKSFNENSGGTSTKRIGYGVDDSQLGGPFIGDNRVVFRAATDSKHYWRVESKDYYTGKGWVLSDKADQRLTFSSEDDVPIYAFEGEVEAKEQSATIYPFIEYPHVVYPFGIKSLRAVKSDYFDIVPNSEKIYLQGEMRNSDEYSMIYYVPRYSVTKLKQVTSAEQARIDLIFLARYTQVPTNLPPEVKELALEITEGKDNWFDKVRAVEAHFNRAIYSYSQKNVAIPKPNEDYVAQFLFDTRVGYCDNFSSSMAILLRTLGIPTRWVKGYTPGEFKQTTNGKRVYEVTNNNAHSWVEVYFPGSGWLAFEPTPGYNNNVSLNFDTYKNDPKTDETPTPEKQPEPKKPEEAKTETKKASTATFSFKKLWNETKLFLKKEWQWFVFGPLALMLIVWTLYRRRTRWMPYYLVWRFKFLSKDENFTSAYLALLRQLDRYGLKRNSNQTLRDYAKYVDQFFSTKEMTRLTDQYEFLLYKGTMQEGSWKKSKELWENLIKKTIA